MSDDAAAMFEHMLELLTRVPDRVPVRMLVGAGVVDALRAACPFELRPAPTVQPSSMAGVPIVEDDKCAPGEWRMIDQYGDQYAAGWMPGFMPPPVREWLRCVASLHIHAEGDRCVICDADGFRYDFGYVSRDLEAARNAETRVGER